MDVIADLKRVPLFETISEADLRPLAEAAYGRRYEKGEVICEKDGPGDALYLIRSGRVRVYTTDEQGHEVTLHIYGPGSFFGELALLDGLPRSASVAAQERSDILVLPRQAFLTCLEAHPRILLEIITAITRRLRITTERAEQMAFLNIYGRIALQLLDLAEKHGRPAGEGTEIAMDLTPEDLASLSGVDLGGLERALEFYQDARLVELRWPRIVVLDEAGLRRRLEWHRRRRLI